MADQRHVLVDGDVLVGDDAAHGGAGLYHGVLEEDAVLHGGALLHLDAPEQHAVAHGALDVAAVAHQGVDALAGGVDVGAGGVVLLGQDGPLRREQLRPDGGVQQLHGPLIVGGHAVDAGGVAIPHPGPEAQLAALILEDVVAEAVTVVGHAVGDQVDKQLLAQHEHVQAAVAGGVVAVVGGVHDAAGVVHLEIGVVTVAGDGGAHAGHVGAGGHVVVQHLLQGQVDDEVAVGQHHVVLADVAQVVHHVAQSLHLAPEVTVVAPALVVGEGGQQLQAAVVAAQAPALAGAQMVQHGLALALHDDAHVGDAGVDEVGQHEIHHPVFTGEGNGAVYAGLDQFPQVGCLLVGEDDAMHSVHLAFSFPWVLSSIVLASTVSPGATWVLGPSTVMPQASKFSASSGEQPTTAPAPMWQFSPTMA